MQFIFVGRQMHKLFQNEAYGMPRSSGSNIDETAFFDLVFFIKVNVLLPNLGASSEQ